ncbi:right-handed parallel beta-helix repeat-containing protein [bacterium]|nr:right-handed parallel beta-helix repeat-containing protein [candidate division CSSED10-310 bacterium]
MKYVIFGYNEAFNMNKMFTSTVLMLFVDCIINAASWPVSSENVAGIMSTYGDFRTGTWGFGYHDGIDITQCHPNCSEDDLRTAVYPARSGEIVGFLPADPPDAVLVVVRVRMGLFENHFDVYEHIVVNPDLKVARDVCEGSTQLGYVAETGQDEYGESSAHLHYGIYKCSGTNQWDASRAYPLLHPYNILPIKEDADAPDFRSVVSDLSSHAIEMLPNICAQNNIEYFSGYIGRNCSPWQVWGQVDILVHVDDYCGATGYYEEHNTVVVPGIFELKWEVSHDEQIINEAYTLKADRFDTSFAGIPPGGEWGSNRLRTSENLYPFRMGTRPGGGIKLQYPGFDTFAQNYNHYVVTNSTDMGDHWELSADGCWDTSEFSEGIYTIKVTAWDYPDADGIANQAESEIEVEVRHADYYVDCTRIYTEDTGTAAHPFRTIKQALDISYDGITILVAPGTYVENSLEVNHNKQLIGMNPETTVIIGDGLPDHWVVGFHADATDHCPSGLIEGFSIVHGGSTSTYDDPQAHCVGAGVIFHNAGHAVLRNCHVFDNFGFGISVSSCSLCDGEVVIENNCIYDNEQDNIILKTSKGTVIRGNTIVHSYMHGLCWRLWDRCSSMRTARPAGSSVRWI